jgi:hypothetical protein
MLLFRQNMYEFISTKLPSDLKCNLLDLTHCDLFEMNRHNLLDVSSLTTAGELFLIMLSYPLNRLSSAYFHESFVANFLRVLCPFESDCASESFKRHANDTTIYTLIFGVLKTEVQKQHFLNYYDYIRIYFTFSLVLSRVLVTFRRELVW